jgi:hypothetical protein
MCFSLAIGSSFPFYVHAISVLAQPCQRIYIVLARICIIEIQILGIGKQPIFDKFTNRINHDVSSFMTDIIFA